jgi:hypothetical protein
MRLFNSKHQKLILQCYPPGKGFDKKANGSELSYLLYYASTRRVKLEKVMVFLEAKTRNDVSHNKAGNLQVTLEIICGLIEKCKDNLNVFASDVCEILLEVLKLKDYQLCKSVLKVYGVLTSNLDSALFAGDKMFVNTFTVLSDQLINLDSNSGPNQLEWKTVSLLSIQYASSCLYYNADLGRHLIEIALPPLIELVHTNVDFKQLVQQVRQNINLEDGNLEKITSRNTEVQEKQVLEHFEEDALTNEDIIYETYICLKSLFNSTLTNQISDLTKEVLKFNFKSNYDLNWGATFLELCTTWIPVQLRFASLSALLTKLTSISKKSTKSTNNYDIQVLYANYILALVGSEVNMIGLSISDVIQQILNLQSNLVLTQSEFLSEDATKNLSSLYSDCICNLSTHIYYFDQVPDSIEELLLKIDSIVEAAKDSRHSKKLFSLIMIFIEDIQDIFAILKKNSSSISRNHVQLEHWEISLPLISLNTKEYKFTAQQITEIQEKYLQVFDYFLNHELTASYDKDGTPTNNSSNSVTTEERQLNHAKIQNDAKIYLEPDFNQYITIGDNFINHFLIQVDKFLHSSPDPETSQILMDVFIDLAYTLGINFIYNFIPFFYYWASPQDGAQTNKLQLTFGYTLIYYSIKILDGKYPNLNGYAGKSQFGKYVLQDIDSRKSNGLWVFGLDPETGGEKTKTRGGSGIIFETNKTNLREFIAGSELLNEWLDPSAPLILDHIKNNDILTKKNGILDGLDDSSHYDLSYKNFQKNGKSQQSYGLGSAHDINSIHSGFQRENSATTPAHLRAGALPPLPSANGYMNGYTHTADVTNTSIISPDVKVYNSPRVADLKGLFNEPKGSLIVFGDSFSGSNGNGQSAAVPEKRPTDIDSILNELNDEDDNRIVV